jgi:DNA-binding winged helix-turn-helix (wHTH) protein
LLYLFENYALDIDRRELRREATVLPVEPLVFDLLAYLLRNRERVVSKDDLRVAVWEGRVVSESTLSSCINAVRKAVGDNGEDQRLIRTLPRKGFRFVGPVREQEETAVPAPAEGSESELVPLARAGRDGRRLDPTTSPANELMSVAEPPRSAIVSRTTVALAISAGLAAIGAMLLFVLWPASDPLRGAATSRSVQRFDAAAVPLVNDEVRSSLASYPGRPDAKALALAVDGMGVADGAPDIQSAKQEALRQCGAGAKTVCRIYAVGMDVVWSRESLPLPASSDLHSVPLDIPLTADAIPTLRIDVRRRIADRFVKALDHKALAITTGGAWLVTEKATRVEAARLAVERCTASTLRPCLLLSVDGFLTIRTPGTHKVVGIFLPSMDAALSGPDKERIARVYQGREWWALARGKRGSWHAVAAAPSEAAATETALTSCSQADTECRVYAVGNFRVTTNDSEVRAASA